MGDTAAYQGGQIGASIGNTMSNNLMQGAQGQASAQLASGTAFNPLLNNLGNYAATANGNGSGLFGNNTNPLTGATYAPGSYASTFGS